jgi:hypothetical protein
MVFPACPYGLPQLPMVGRDVYLWMEFPPIVGVVCMAPSTQNPREPLYLGLGMGEWEVLPPDQGFTLR